MHFDPSSTEQFQTSVTETVHLTLGTHSVASGMQYSHRPNVKIVLAPYNLLFENRDPALGVITSALSIPLLLSSPCCPFFLLSLGCFDFVFILHV